MHDEGNETDTNGLKWFIDGGFSGISAGTDYVLLKYNKGMI